MAIQHRDHRGACLIVPSASSFPAAPRQSEKFALRGRPGRAYGYVGRRFLPRSLSAKYGMPLSYPRRTPTQGVDHRQVIVAPAARHTVGLAVTPAGLGREEAAILIPVPRSLPVMTRDEGNQTSARQGSHFEIPIRRQERSRVDTAQFLRTGQFP